MVSPLKRRLEETITDGDLKLALKTHKYGLLVNVEDYELLEDDDPFCYMPFSGRSELVARKLEGCLIQSGTDIILCLKVEVYGRSPDEDPRGINEGASQLMIGTVRWNALVTMAVVLTSGKIVVGPNNTIFNPHAASHVWLKKGGGKDIDIGNFVGIQEGSKRMVSIKLAAFIFHKLYSESGVALKSQVEGYLQEIRPKKGDDDDRGIHSNLKRLVQAMDEEEKPPVSSEVGKELKDLAGRVQKEQTKLNLTIVATEVEKVIEGVLKGKK
ncbi:hypothetical protein BGZ74_003999 [Mortierella antarctica]|nr:hypothetical protein BGZ74_003999 [Mortierella antarctica]